MAVKLISHSDKEETISGIFWKETTAMKWTENYHVECDLCGDCEDQSMRCFAGLYVGLHRTSQVPYGRFKYFEYGFKPSYAIRCDKHDEKELAAFVSKQLGGVDAR